MTIAAAYLVSDGVVLGADSSTTVSAPMPTGQTGVIQVLTHAQKVFEVGEKSRFGVCTWGDGSLGETSHRTVIARLGDSITEKTSVKEAANILADIAHPLAERAGVDLVGYFLGGWNPVSREPACFMVEVKKSRKKIQPIELGHCVFSGNPQFFARVFSGYDPSLRENLRKQLRSVIGTDALPADFDSLYDNAFNDASAPLVAAGYSNLPIREAIDFVYSYLHVTVKAMKFSFGPPAAGGPIEIAFVSTDRRFRWAHHKGFSSALLADEAQYDIGER